MHSIFYIEKIRKVGWFGIPYVVLKLRTAHMDEQSWRRMRNRPFSMAALMGCAELPGD